jgi:predicted metal-dependent phosphoesterase TrpH
MAVEADLSAIALTDHDTVAGVQEMLDAAVGTDLHVIPGVEISCRRGDHKYHVLGYYIDWERSELVDRLKYFEEARADRIRRMVKVLRDERNINISYDAIESLAGKSLIGKPHVAQALVNNGTVDSFREAFANFLGDGQILDKVPKERMSYEEAVNQINDAGGIPVLAHPIHYEDSLNLGAFATTGIEGVEIFYSDHGPQVRENYYREARQLDLLVTGGSDFHGDVKPDVELGDIRVPEQFLDALQHKSRQNNTREDILPSA